MGDVMAVPKGTQPDIWPATARISAVPERRVTRPELRFSVADVRCGATVYIRLDLFDSVDGTVGQAAWSIE